MNRTRERFRLRTGVGRCIDMDEVLSCDRQEPNTGNARAAFNDDGISRGNEKAVQKIAGRDDEASGIPSPETSC